MKIILGLLTALLISCTTKPPTALVIPRALPATQILADTTTTKTSFRKINQNVRDLTTSSNNLTSELKKAEKSHQILKGKADRAYKQGLNAGSAEAENLSLAVTQMSTDLKAAKLYGSQISEKLITSEKNVNIASEELHQVQENIVRMDVERNELRAIANEQTTQLSELTSSNFNQAIENKTLTESRSKWRRWTIMLATISAAYIALKLTSRFYKMS